MFTTQSNIPGCSSEHEVRETADAERQLQDGCGTDRTRTKRLLQTGLRKLDAGEALNESELKVVLYLGNRFIWKPAFTDEQLFEEFRAAALENHLLSPDEARTLDRAKTFIALYAIALMHGSSVAMEDGRSGQLVAGFSNKDRHFEVKVQITFEDGPKPILAPICMFLTALQPEGVCDPDLLQPSGGPLPHVWRRPLEIDAAGWLGFVG